MPIPLARYRLLLLLVLTLLAPFGTPAADAAFRIAAGRLAPSLAAVVSCSPNPGDGQLRVVVFERGFEHVSSEVYLQWIQQTETGPRLLKSTPVAELSTGLWSIGQPVIISKGECAIRLDATHTYSNEAASFRLRPRGLGRYAIGRVDKVSR